MTGVSHAVCIVCVFVGVLLVADGECALSIAFSCLLQSGVDVRQWWNAMPKRQRNQAAPSLGTRGRQFGGPRRGRRLVKAPPSHKTIDRYYESRHCLLCDVCLLTFSQF